MQMTFFTTKTTFQLEILKCCTSYLTVPRTYNTEGVQQSSIFSGVT